MLVKSIMKYLLGLDIGTTSLKGVVFSEDLKPLKTVKKDYTLITKGDFVEFPAEKYWDMVKEALDEVRAEYDIYALSIDTQCETIIVTDEGGKPLDNAIVWLDNRATAQAEEIKEKFGEKRVYEVTGQPEITATWPASKLLWLKEKKKEVFDEIKKVFLLEDWLLYKLTGKFITEETLQSSTIYFDVNRRVWWKEMLDFIGIDEACFPTVYKSGDYVGDYEGIKVVTSAIDQIAGAIGVGVVKKGVISEMTGTTMVVFMPADEVPPYNPDSKVPCHLNYDGKYCLLSWTPTAGIALKWFKNNFCEQYPSFDDLNVIASEVPAGSAGLTFLPYLCGATMPKYNPDAKGVFYGLTMEHTRGHFVRSIMESISCMLKGTFDYLGINCDEVRATGGGAQSALWCQIKADMTGKSFVTLENEETACLGSAILAGVGTGVFESVEEAAEKSVKIKKTYKPSGVDYTECYERYCALDKKLFY